jgi:hypothetical protein
MVSWRDERGNFSVSSQVRVHVASGLSHTTMGADNCHGTSEAGGAIDNDWIDANALYIHEKIK